MLVSRSKVIVGAAPVGVALGAVVWIVFGAGAPMFERLDDFQAQLAGARSGKAAATKAAGDPTADLVAAPLFMLTTGPKGVPEPVIRLDGVSRSPTRAAALLSINGGPAFWLEKGQTRDGVSLTRVSGAGVTVETAYGDKEIGLNGVPDAAAASTTPPGAVSNSEIPKGVRLPPPPASAPGG